MIRSDSEKQIVGAWLNGYCLEDMDMFKAEDFPTYGKMVELMKKGETDHLKIVRGCGMSPAIPGMLTRESEIGEYNRCLADAMEDLGHRYLEENMNLSLVEIQDGLKKFTRRASGVPKPNEDAVVDLIEEIADRATMEIVRTGIPSLDRMMNGIRPDELTFVGARPSVGKSAFMQQVTTRVARQGKRVLFFPLEMSRSAILQRMLLTLIEVSQYDLKRGNPEVVNSEQFKRATVYMDNFIREGNFLIFPRVNDINLIRQAIDDYEPYMIVIDQLEQLKDGNRLWNDKRARFSHMTHELQAISLDDHIGVWTACQVNRGADDTPPTMANLKESGTIEEDATNVILLHRLSDKKDPEQTIQLELAKQKDGECGVFDMTFEAPRYTFHELAYGY